MNSFGFLRVIMIVWLWWALLVSNFIVFEHCVMSARHFSCKRWAHDQRIFLPYSCRFTNRCPLKIRTKCPRWFNEYSAIEYWESARRKTIVLITDKSIIFIQQNLEDLTLNVHWIWNILFCDKHYCNSHYASANKVTWVKFFDLCGLEASSKFL